MCRTNQFLCIRKNMKKKSNGKTKINMFHLNTEEFSRTNRIEMCLCVIQNAITFLIRVDESKYKPQLCVQLMRCMRVLLFDCAFESSS